MVPPDYETDASVQPYRMSIEHQASRSCRTKKARPLGYVWYCSIALFFTLSSWVLILQQINFDLAVERGLVVPDVVNIALTLENFWIQGGLLQWSNPFIGITIFYGWTWFLHPALCYAENVVLIMASIAMFRRVGLQKLKAPSWTILGLLGNPYLVLAMPGPNKEIPLLLLTLYLVDCLLRDDRRWWSALGFCALMYTLRDGYGLFLMLCVCSLWVLDKRERHLPAMMLGLLATAACLFGPLASIAPVLGRNLAIYQDLISSQPVGGLASALALDPLSTLDGLTLYGLRLMYNLLSMALFPVLHNQEGQVYWIGLGYWLFGILILAALLGCALRTQSNSRSDRHRRLGAALGLCVWFMVSLSLFVQPRYLMPILPIAFAALGTVSSRSRWLCISTAVAISLTAILINQVLERASLEVGPEQFATPPYIWQS
ncbi:hypothetical protein [Hydrogenophaga sp. PBL-H3]|uniref:hypothetical protein n=1 Tax=Hydrogenophaga sp. PBL-H3 TaxID=434010 RepID=UPI0013200291|nr:hypothetical protein [Hydrogenophaga sp. PBL-H3]QHE78145.1 hypothetical protein F9Z45_19960 [Hydrogenophaga sp. PBL-H3]QHE82570.1 hypothetical protein F9Z44_19960 [Hydrogenophaga sp. PBL-H3]